MLKSPRIVENRLKKLAGESEPEERKGLIGKVLDWRRENTEDSQAFVRAWKREMAENPDADPAEFARKWAAGNKGESEEPLEKKASDIVETRLKKLAEGEGSEDSGSFEGGLDKIRAWIKENPEVAKKILGQAAVGAGLGGASGYMLGEPGNRLKSGLGGMAMGTGIGGALGSQDFLNRIADKPAPVPEDKNLLQEWSDRSNYFLFGE